MLKTFSGRLLGGTCFLCRGWATELLCVSCAAELPPPADPACPRCGLAAPAGAVCGRCLSAAPAYDATLCGLEYAFPVDALIHALKFRGELALVPLLADTLAGRLPAAGVIDCIAPVPLSPPRLRERGYNQAGEIAKVLAARSGAPLRLQLCERIRDAPPQSELPWKAREANVRGAFRCTGAVTGQRIAVVDDVMTTGATLEAMARALKSAGAASVVNLVVARTAPPS